MMWKTLEFFCSFISCQCDVTPCNTLHSIIIRLIAHHVQDGYTLVENTLMTIKNPWEKKVSQNKWDTETSTT